MTTLRDHSEQLALAAFYDREPTCQCCDTDRGTDALGCEVHDGADRRQGQASITRAEAGT